MKKVVHQKFLSILSIPQLQSVHWHAAAVESLRVITSLSHPDASTPNTQGRAESMANSNHACIFFLLCVVVVVLSTIKHKNCSIFSTLQIAHIIHEHFLAIDINSHLVEGRCEYTTIGNVCSFGASPVFSAMIRQRTGTLLTP